MATTKVFCSNCGAEVQLNAHEHTVANAKVIGEDSNLGNIYLPMKKYDRVADMIAALKSAGVNTDNYRAMSINGKERMVENTPDGGISIIEENDPVWNAIKQQPKLWNKFIFKQQVLGQMFTMLSFAGGYNDALTNKGRYYQITMLNDEFTRQSAMYRHGDNENLEICNSIFNKNIALDVANQHLKDVIEYIDSLKVKHHKRFEYKYIQCLRRKNSNYKGTYVSKIESDVIRPIKNAIRNIRWADDPIALHQAFEDFVKVSLHIPDYYHRTVKRWVGNEYKDAEQLCYYSQVESWKNAYMVYGAYWSMQNLIEFHDCKLLNYDHRNEESRGKNAMLVLNRKLEQYKYDGWWLLGMLKNMLKYNNIDIAAKKKEWREARIAKQAIAN